MVGLKEWWRRVRPAVVSRPIVWLARAIGATLNIEIVGEERVRDLTCGKVLCGWHGQSFLAALKFRNQGYYVMISQSRDGEIQKNIFAALGFRIIRGSSGRGGVRAAVESIRALRDGASMAMTPDGPRGPTRIVQGGVMTMAQKSGAALIPTGTSARPRWLAKSWDRYMIPMPFAKATIALGEPVYVPKDATEEQIEALRLQLQRAIDDTQARSDAAVGL